MNKLEYKSISLDSNMNKEKSFIPFVEKYRPSDMESIILDLNNKKILYNIIENKIYPNLLLYGPPGTGKTTTIINLINKIHSNSENTEFINKSLILHLNASDERGIDMIRNQIQKFITSKPLFKDNIKFIVLDEVDYMTKSAQIALKYLLQKYNTENLIFYLMCNYISKIDESLKNEFIELKFYNTPKESIILFLKNIVEKENIYISDNDLQNIQEYYGSDIRSMINYIQLNFDNSNKITLLNKHELELLHKIIINKKQTILDIEKRINILSIKYNINNKIIIISYIKYIIKNSIINIDEIDIINKLETILHNRNHPDYSSSYLITIIRNKCFNT